MLILENIHNQKNIKISPDPTKAEITPITILALQFLDVYICMCVPEKAAYSFKKMHWLDSILVLQFMFSIMNCQLL